MATGWPKTPILPFIVLPAAKATLVLFSFCESVCKSPGVYIAISLWTDFERCCHKTWQVCIWYQSEGRVWRWVWPNNGTWITRLKGRGWSGLYAPYPILRHGCLGFLILFFILISQLSNILCFYIKVFGYHFIQNGIRSDCSWFHKFYLVIKKKSFWQFLQCFIFKNYFFPPLLALCIYFVIYYLYLQDLRQWNGDKYSSSKGAKEPQLVPNQNILQNKTQLIEYNST